jgi:peptide/nickel transport system permease protein
MSFKTSPAEANGLEIPGSERAAQVESLERFGKKLARNPMAILGLVVILFAVTVALLAPILATHPPTAQSLHDQLSSPSQVYWFGTDDLGRDIYSRLIYGARITLYIVGLVTLISVPIGLFLGAAAGYLGGWIDSALMRVTDVFLALPGLILSMAFVAAMGPGIDNAILAIALTLWPQMARLARAESMLIRNSEFIEAARMMGAPALRIVLRHVVPICLPSVIVRATLNMAGVILAASALGFLGLGAQPPTPEWGAMLSSARSYLQGYWWIATFPGLAILLLSLAFNLLGDGLRDILDPRSR